MLIRLDKNLRRLRKEAGITQEQLANKLGVSFQAVSRWETGAAYPDITLLPELANTFHITVDSLLGITEARERDIGVVAAELKAASTAPVDAQAIISCLRELRHFHLASADFWPTIRTIPWYVLQSADVRPELRMVFDAVWESDVTNAYVKSNAVVWRALWEDEDKMESFLENYSTSADLSRDELLRARAEFRQDWDALEPLRQRVLMDRITDLAVSSPMWLPQGRPATPKELLDLTSLQLKFLNSISFPESAYSDAVFSGTLDGWAKDRAYDLGLLRCGCMAALGQTEQAMTVLKEITELMEKAFSIPLPASIPCPAPWFPGGEWTVLEIWRPCWWKDPEQEERCLDFLCMGCHSLLTPSWVVGTVTGKGIVKMAGFQWMEPLRSHPDYPGLLDRLQRLVVTRRHPQ